MATAAKQAPSTTVGRTPPFQPDYPDEVSDAQLAAIREIVGEPDRAAARKVLYSPAW